MMKVLWVINRVLPMFYKELGMMENNFGGGWLTGLANTLRKTEGITFAVASYLKGVSGIKSGSVDGVGYYFYPQGDIKEYNAAASDYIHTIAEDFKPDVVHVFGTEYPLTLEVLNAVVPDKVLISLTGIITEYAKVYRGGLSKINRRGLLYALGSLSPRLFFMRNRQIVYGEEVFIKRAGIEQQTMSKAKYVSGRTGFDRTFAKKSNPDVRYFYCNESLRDPFYTGETWDAGACRKHSIFISNAGYPIKGFHMVLEAARDLVKQYPDLMICVAGNSPFSNQKGIKNKLVQWTDEYGLYLQKKIGEYGLAAHVMYLGNIDADTMKAQFLKANVFVLSSIIENSPNSLGEAMLLGTPCVASDVGGVSDLMVNGKEGLIYRFEDIEGLRKYIVRVFEDPVYAGELGQKAREHAMQTHSLETNNQTMLSIYQTIIDNNK